MNTDPIPTTPATPSPEQKMREAIQKAVTATLLPAINGMERRYRNEGGFIRWGLVESEMIDAIVSALLPPTSHQPAPSDGNPVLCVPQEPCIKHRNGYFKDDCPDCAADKIATAPISSAPDGAGTNLDENRRIRREKAQRTVDELNDTSLECLSAISELAYMDLEQQRDALKRENGELLGELANQSRVKTSELDLLRATLAKTQEECDAAMKREEDCLKGWSEDLAAHEKSAADLRASLAQAQRDVEEAEVSKADWMQTAQRRSDLLTAASQEVEGLKRDKERLDWLAKVYGGGPITEWQCEQSMAIGRGLAKHKEDFRSAIDTARLADKGTEGKP